MAAERERGATQGCCPLVRKVTRGGTDLPLSRRLSPFPEHLTGILPIPTYAAASLFSLGPAVARHRPGRARATPTISSNRPEIESRGGPSKLKNYADAYATRFWRRCKTIGWRDKKVRTVQKGNAITVGAAHTYGPRAEHISAPIYGKVYTPVGS